jgi:N-acetylglucosamine-6-sulfatase
VVALGSSLLLAGSCKPADPVEPVRPVPAQEARLRPSFVVIVSYDQRWDTLSPMRVVNRTLVDRGVTFQQAFVVNPECCPSRAGILTGQYSHTNGVYSNHPESGIRAFRDGSTLATWLDAEGYRTALFGKYLNNYEGRRVPKGWDDWAAYSGHASYHNYTLNEDGRLRSYGNTPLDYATDVLTQKATSFIRSTPTSRPLFLYFAPFTPHSPSVAAPRHRSIPRLSPLHPPSHNEADVSDKPQWIRELPLLSNFQQAELDLDRIQEHQALRALDEAVGRIVGELRSTGRLANTLIIYMSDNGRALGEHRLTRKWAPYEEMIRIPFVVRYDPLVSKPRADRHLVTNIDVAPTLIQLAGAHAQQTDGRSLAPLLVGTPINFRTHFLIEHLHVPSAYANPPTYCAIRSRSKLYVRYETGEEELYLLSRDPYQLTNRAEDPALGAVVGRMRAEARRMCRPRPPGMSPF